MLHRYGFNFIFSEFLPIGVQRGDGNGNDDGNHGNPFDFSDALFFFLFIHLSLAWRSRPLRAG